MFTKTWSLRLAVPAVAGALILVGAPGPAAAAPVATGPATLTTTSAPAVVSSSLLRPRTTGLDRTRLRLLSRARVVTTRPVARVGTGSFPLSGTDVQRTADALVRFTSAIGAATPTNVYGAEAVVVGGEVVALHDRQASNAEATAVPTDGYVLSGHGTARDWLLRHAVVGAAVTVPSSAPSPPPTTTADDAPLGYPSKAVATYHMMWNNGTTPALSRTPANVNVVNLAFAQGRVPKLPGWGSQSEASFIADARALRARGVRIVLSVGGAGGAMQISDREAFVQGVMAINAKLPLDGLDWDLEGVPMAAADVLALSARLKELRGERFAITMAPNGSNIDAYRAIAVQLHAQGDLDMIGQQFYDAVVAPVDARWRIAQLVSAGIPQDRIGIGMMVGSLDTYWTVDECVAAVTYLKSHFPHLRGGYLWEAGRPGTLDWSQRVGALLG